MAVGMLEAVAQGGLHVVNPLFVPPWDRENNMEMKGKPTSQILTSQNPFLENFLGPPFVYNVNPLDTAVSATSTHPPGMFQLLVNIESFVRKLKEVWQQSKRIMIGWTKWKGLHSEWN